ncbi:nucleoid-associated protein [Methanococcus sp. CF]
MTDLLQDIILDNIIVHQIFQRIPDEEAKKPIFSDNFEKLDKEGKKALEYRLNWVLNKESKRMNLEITNDSPESTFQKMAYLATYKYANPEKDHKNPEFWNKYVETTKQLTWNLQEAQATNPNIPNGIVIIITGQTGPEMNDFSAVIKAEMEDGFEFTDNKLQYISNLLLTETQKLYKVGIFIDVNPEDRSKSGLRNKEDFKAFVFDDNTSKTAVKNNVAIYFYNTFLGCSLEDSARATKRFLEGAKSIVAGLPIPQEEKVLKVNQVYSYLTSNTKEINAKEFVETYIEPDYQVEFLDKLEKKEVPLHSVPKDIEPIKKKLKSRTLSFSSGVQLKFSFEETQEPVEIVESTDEHTIVKIRGKLSKQ